MAGKSSKNSNKNLFIIDKQMRIFLVKTEKPPSFICLTWRIKKEQYFLTNVVKLKFEILVVTLISQMPIFKICSINRCLLMNQL